MAEKPGDTNVPYQPAFDMGISPEMDRLNFDRIQLIKRKYAGGLTPEAEFARFSLRKKPLHIPVSSD